MSDIMDVVPVALGGAISIGLLNMASKSFDLDKTKKKKKQKSIRLLDLVK